MIKRDLLDVIDNIMSQGAEVHLDVDRILSFEDVVNRFRQRLNGADRILDNFELLEIFVYYMYVLSVSEYAIVDGVERMNERLEHVEDATFGWGEDQLILN